MTHSGAGRIARLKMYTMSLYESGDSTGDVAIMDMFNSTVKCGYIRKVELSDLAKFIIKGGWPANNDKDIDDIDLIPKSYIESLLSKDINEDNGKQRDRNKMLMILRSLARNESTLVGEKTVLKDIEDFENDEELIKSRTTILDYIDCLDRLHLIENQDAFSLNYRSSNRVGKVPKRHFTDPSLACACLNLTIQKLLDGKLYHFRDNSSGDEVDSILEFSDGEYGAVEIKLTLEGIDEAKKSLTTFYNNVKIKPKFMCIIVGHCEAVIKDSETGIYIIPITSLKP